MGAGTRGIVLLGFLAVFDGCELGQSCTEIGCSDGAGLTVRRADGTLAAGAYTLSFTVEGRTHVCQFRMPEDLPTSPGQVKNLDCEPALGLFGVSVLPEVMCTETRTAGAVSQSCTPIPDRWYFSTMLDGTPPEVPVAAERDGVELLSEQRTLAYRTEYPNGPECGGGCRNADAMFVLP